MMKKTTADIRKAPATMCPRVKIIADASRLIQGFSDLPLRERGAMKDRIRSYVESISRMILLGETLPIKSETTLGRLVECAIADMKAEWRGTKAHRGIRTA
jgi:hypothetical protein